MIRLNVKPYCNDCPMFEAASTRDVNIYYVDGVPIEGRPKDCKVVFCKNNRQCSAIYEYLKKEVFKDG